MQGIHINDFEVIVNTAGTLSPYSYYEQIYTNETSKNSTLQHDAKITTRQSTVVVTEGMASTQVLDESTITIATVESDTTEKLIAPYQHASMRNIYYDTLPLDTYRPLGRQLYSELARYRNSEIHTYVYKASLANPTERCTLLGKVLSEIDYYKEIDSSLREMNSRRDLLSAMEHADEIIVRRKLITAYLAAEHIINKKSISDFYINAMADNKTYTDTELANRYAYVINYFPMHHDEY